MSDEITEKTEQEVEVKEKKADAPAPKPRTRAKAAPAAAAPTEAPAEAKAPETKAPEAVEAPPPPVRPERPEKAKIKLNVVPEGVKYQATGRRKEAVARILLMKGDGKIVINNRPAEVYMARSVNMLILKQPLELTGTTNMFNIVVNVAGGGQSGQAGAIKHAISRALCKFQVELRAPLKKAGHLARDSRKVERKKYGQAKARKRFQFSKR
jgi:small subunit ribosomal protein S9